MTRDVARRVLDMLCDAAEEAERLAVADRAMSAASVLAEGVRDAVTVLAPYAGTMPTPYPHTLLVLRNGSTLRTTQNAPADIAGLINVGTEKIYPVTDLDGVTHHLVVSAILDFYEVTAP